jgi:uncharacterized protein (DUF427 family)
MKACWNGTVLADSDDTIALEGNVYFPPGSVKREYLRDSRTRTECPWKGTAHYYHVVTPTGENPDAAWYYPDPEPAARQICNYVAFWNSVEIRP